MTDDEIITGFMRRYGPSAGAPGPEMFVEEILGASPDKWQRVVLRAYGRGERRISIKSCHGPGKTAVLAWLVIYQLNFRHPQKVIATAPSRGQLEDALVAEVMMWFKRLPDVLQNLFECKKNRIELKADRAGSFFVARTAREESPESLQGGHSEHILFIGDEASGIPEAIFEATMGSMSGQHAITLLAGNPVRTSGYFYESHNRMKKSWFTVHVTGVEEDADESKGSYYSPRVTEQFVQEVADAYGRDSNAFRIRAMGEFPLTDLNTVISAELVLGAQERDIVVPKNAPEVWGVDCARQGDDMNCLVRRTGLSLKPLIMVWHSPDLMVTAGKIKSAYDDCPTHLRPIEILIDVIGIGAGVVDRLTEQGLPVRGVNVSEQRSVSDTFHNLRTQLWFDAKDWFGGRDVSIPKKCVCKTCLSARIQDNHAVLLEQELLAQKAKYRSTGKTICYPKEEMKKHLRPQRSPNIGDAFVLTFAGEAAALSVTGSRGGAWGGFSWNEEIHLNRNVV